MARPRTEQAEGYRSAILEFVQLYRREHGFPPRVSEMCEKFGLSRSSVAWHLKVLKDEGYVEFEPGDSRTLSVTRKGGDAVRRTIARREKVAAQAPVNTRRGRATRDH